MQIAAYATVPAVSVNAQSLAELGANSITRQFEKEADKAAALYLGGRQESPAGFEAAGSAARAALEQN